MTGVIVLGVALVASVVLGSWYRRRNGRFRAPVADTPEPQALTAEQIGHALGEKATLVQFSSAFCAPCRATRTLLTDVATKLDGVEAVEVDAELQLDLVRRLDIMRTPTTFVLDARGHVVTRASGLPRREQVLSVLAGIPGVIVADAHNVD